MPKKTFADLLKDAVNFHWQNNVNGLASKLGIPSDSLADQYQRGLGMVASGLTLIPPDRVAKLVDADQQWKPTEAVQVRTDEELIYDHIIELLALLDTAKTAKPSTEYTRHMAVMYTHVEEAYMRLQFVMCNKAASKK